jgi:hypothetical protein
MVVREAYIHRCPLCGKETVVYPSRCLYY